MQLEPIPQQQPTPQPKKGKKIWPWVVGIFGGLIILGQLSNDNSPAASTTSSVEASPTDTTMLATTAVEEKPVEPVSNWYSFENEDKMGAKSTVTTVDAKELLEFDFPYNGGSTASFVVRRKGGETDTYLKVSKGQFNSTYDGGTVRIRFDQGKPTTYSFSGASDGSSDIVFINSSNGIIKKLRTAKRMVIEAEFYNEGLRQIEFDVEGFKWK
ncbi:hypothetical protein [Fibrella aestuarina]|uniref:hypothetical protein n=1 Tax=Fibrella aestuarina TaxID=651143 RepID=UPI0006868FF5|nr:hypothetical protein [Fibrella aestuarina]